MTHWTFCRGVLFRTNGGQFVICAEAVVLDQARAKGITFLHKPFSPRVLAETVRKCLDAD